MKNKANEILNLEVRVSDRNSELMERLAAMISEKMETTSHKLPTINNDSNKINGSQIHADSSRGHEIQ